MESRKSAALALARMGLPTTPGEMEAALEQKKAQIEKSLQGQCEGLIAKAKEEKKKVSEKEIGRRVLRTYQSGDQMVTEIEVTIEEEYEISKKAELQKALQQARANAQAAMGQFVKACLISLALNGYVLSGNDFSFAFSSADAGIPEAFTTGLATIENGIKAGWDKKQELWFPHASVEGGLKTIAYGHKLTSASQFSSGITESQARQLLESDVSRAYQHAEGIYDKKFGSGEFAKCPHASRLVATDLAYNLGPGGFAKFNDFMQAMKDGDLAAQKRECRTSCGGKPLTARHKFRQEILDGKHQ